MSATWFDGVTVTVEIGFASNPLATTITWTDVTDYVREITVDRGRTSEFDEVQAGRAQILLDNRDRRFDPLHPSGAYYPNVLPNKAVRIRAEYASTTYDLWYGYVDRWTQDYEPPNDAVCVLEATDGFRLLQSEQLPDSVWSYTVASSSDLWGWWRLNETDGVTAYDSSGNDRHMPMIGSPTGSTGLTFGSNDGALTFDGVDDAAELNESPTSGPISFALLWRPSSAVLAADPFDANYGYGLTVGSPQSDFPNSWYWGWYWAFGTFYVFLNRHSTTVAVDTAELTVSLEDKAYFVLGTVPLTASATMRLYVDGSSDTATTTGTCSPHQRTVLGSGGVSWSAVGYMEGVLDEVVVWTSDQSASESTYRAAATAPWDGDDTGARIGRVLDMIGWPSGLRTLGTGVTILGPASLDSAWALDYLRDVARTEDGLLFMGVDGKVVFRNRHWRLTASAATTSAATFSDAAGTSYPYRDLELDGYSVQWIRNRVVARRDGGASEVSAEDSTSQTAYGRITDDLGTTLHRTDVEVENLVQWRLGQRKDPKMRVTRLTVAPRKAPTTLFPQVLARDIGERITVNRTPQGVGSAISQASWIEGISHRITPGGTWDTTWTLSPADPQTYLVLNDATLGQLDSNALAY